MKNIAIFASGSGTNAQAIFDYFSATGTARIALILSNNPNAYVLERSKGMKVPSIVFSRDEFYNSSSIIDVLKLHSIDYVVLAGFLWLVPSNLTQMFANRMINIHPALLPKYGGKGMYGMKVHEAVVANQETESGITIHFVNDVYDSGDIIFQASCPVLPTDTAEMVAQKVHELEYKHFPREIEKVMMNR